MSFGPLDILIIFLPISYLLTHRRESLWRLLNATLAILVGIALLLYILIFSPASKSFSVQDSVLGNFLVSEVAQVEGAIHSLHVPKEEASFTIPFKPSVLKLDENSEQELFNLVNEERAKAGLKALTLDQGITRAAREHSLDMWQRQYFNHDTPDDLTPFTRMAKNGVDFRRAGENIALARTVTRAHQGLMNSEGHRENILDPNFSRIGIGVIDAGVYGKMFTEDFAN